jgi:hypothetical protein
LLPTRDLAAGLLEHPRSEREDQTTVLGELDELGGGEDSPLGVVPPDERLGSDDAVITYRDDRLVVEPKLVPIDGSSQLVLALQSVADAGSS